MTPAHITKLGLITQKTSVGTQKIDNSPLQIYSIGSVRFSLQNSLGRVWFFKETFLLAATSMKVVLEMLYLAFNYANFWFNLEKLPRNPILLQKSYLLLVG